MTADLLTALLLYEVYCAERKTPRSIETINNISSQQRQPCIDAVNRHIGLLVKGQKFKIEVLLNILGRSWQVVSKYSFGSPES